MAHEHRWELIYNVGERKVRRCIESKCDEYQSLAYDYQSNEWRWYPGNLWLRDQPLYIVTGEYDEFQEVASILSKACKLSEIVRLETLSQITDPNPTILLWGTWWEADIIRDDQFKYYLNLRAG